MPNKPTFKEKEENGIYTATLDGITDKGTSIQQKIQLDLKLMRESETERLLKLGLGLDAIDVHIKTYIANQKTSGIQDLHKYFEEHFLKYSNNA